MTTFHRRSPIAFAHRGGKADFPENTLQAFRNAIASGVDGLEADVWMTADGEVVIDHDGLVRSWFGLRRLSVNDVHRSRLPKHVPTLADLYDLCGDRFEVALDIKDLHDAERVVRRVVDIARSAGGQATRRLYLAHAGFKTSDWQQVAGWRSFDEHLHLMDSTRPGRFDLPPVDYGRRAVEAGLDVINMPGRAWTPQLVEMFHGVGLRCFAFNVQDQARMRQLVDMGIDALFSDHVRRLVHVLPPMPPPEPSTSTAS